MKAGEILLVAILLLILAVGLGPRVVHHVRHEGGTSVHILSGRWWWERPCRRTGCRCGCGPGDCRCPCCPR
jgi:hypothetical protein